MKKLVVALFGALMAMSMFSCQQSAKETQVKEKPMFCTWYTYNPQEDFDSICRSFNELGIDGIVLKVRWHSLAQV